MLTFLGRGRPRPRGISKKHPKDIPWKQFICESSLRLSVPLVNVFNEFCIFGVLTKYYFELRT